MRFSNLNNWLSWQERLHPTDIELGLERVSEVWNRLRPAGLGCTVIAIGGTNGKGSCAAMLDAILGAAGYRSGCYTSPHLLRYNERIRIRGEPVGDDVLCAAFDRVDKAREGVSLTYFEFGTLAALDLFTDARLDAAILEVGLGGRLDAVNLLDSDVALISSVGLDHMAWLGPDLDSIGREKAGIFRSGRPAVIGESAPPAGLVETARDLGTPLLLAGKDYRAEVEGVGWDWHGPRRSRRGLPLPALRSRRQVDNAAAVLMVLDLLAEPLPVDQAAVRTGLQQARLPGRLQVLGGEVTLILDVAHNLPAASNLAADLRGLATGGETHVVFGTLQDKDAAGMIAALHPQADRWYLAALEGSRAAPLSALQVAYRGSGIASPVGAYRSVPEAFAAAQRAAKPADRILVTGSFVTVAAVLAIPAVGERAGLV
jgi:dihydrofolate synthase/folylpolyglutamate synthase